MRARVITAVAIVALVAAGAAIALGGSEEQPANDSGIPAEYYGIAGHVLRLMAGNGELDLLDRHLDRLQPLGLSFVRANLDWLQLEPSAPQAGRHSYDFSTHDDWVAALARHGLRWYVIGYGTPEWAAVPAARAAGCSIFAPPADPADYAALMGAVAGRYGSNGTFWKEHPDLPYRPAVDFEIWNEPNLGSAWCPAPNPAAYAGLIAAAAPAVRETDPEARIVLGGLSPFEEPSAATPGGRPVITVGELLGGALEAESRLADLVDAVGIHAYGEPKTVLDQVAFYRDTLDGLGLQELPMSLNETGWTTSGEGGFTAVSEQVRARYMTEVTAAVARSECDVVSFAPHTWVTEEQDPNQQGQWFGLADPRTGAPYPSARAYATVARELPPGSPRDGGAVACGD